MMKRKSYFNKRADTWDDQFYPQMPTTFLEKFIPRFGLKPGQNILDIGTGTGILIPFLLQSVESAGSITAIDYAEKMVKICQSKYSHIKNVTIELQDVKKLNFPSDTFDAVTCFRLFPHLENKEQALTNLYLVLKYGGKLIIAHNLSSAEIKGHHNISLAVAHNVLPKEPEMKRFLNRVGFMNISIEDKPGHYLCISTK